MSLEDLSPKALNPTSVRDKTLVYHVNLDRSTVNIPRQISWNEIINETQWDFRNITHPRPIKQDKPTFFIEDDRRNVQLHFDPVEPRTPSITSGGRRLLDSRRSVDSRIDRRSVSFRIDEIVGSTNRLREVDFSLLFDILITLRQGKKDQVLLPFLMWHHLKNGTIVSY